MGLREVEGFAQGHRVERGLEASSSVSHSCALGLVLKLLLSDRWSVGI